MRLKSTNIKKTLESSGFHLEQHLPHRDLWDQAPGRIALFDKSQITERELRWFNRDPLQHLTRWLEIAAIDSNGQIKAQTEFIIALKCV